jgi:hypothetical protein
MRPAWWRDRLCAAQVALRAYAKTQTPHVPQADVDQLVRALDTVSLDEACRALDRWEAEAR